MVAWADDATVVLQGSPASGRALGPNESWGDLGTRRLLDPDPLEQLMARPWSAHFDVNGQLLDDNTSALPELVSLGTDHYEVTYDAELDVLTSWTAFIDGQPITSQRLLGLSPR